MEIGKKYRVFLGYDNAEWSEVGVLKAIEPKQEGEKTDWIILQTGNGEMRYPFLFVKSFELF